MDASTKNILSELKNQMLTNMYTDFSLINNGKPIQVFII